MDGNMASEPAPGPKQRVQVSRVRWVPLPVSLLPLLLPRLVQLRFSPLDTNPGIRPLSAPSSRSCPASIVSSRWDGKPPAESGSS